MLLKEKNLPHCQNSWFFLSFWYFEHSLIRRKCPFPCVFQLTDVYCKLIKQRKRKQKRKKQNKTE